MPEVSTPGPREEWTRILLPRRGIFQIPWGEIWRYRDLILLLARRDRAANYKQTMMGPLWYILQPLSSAVVFTVIFGRVAGLGPAGLPHILFYFSGITLWQFFAECINKTAVTFQRNSAIFDKVYFPRLIMPISTALSALVGFAVQFSTFLLLLAFYWVIGKPVHPNGSVVLLPIFILQLGMLGVGVGCIVAALSTKVRDLTLGIGLIVQLWMFASAIVFPLSKVPPQDRWLFLLNPVVSVLEAFRYAFLGYGEADIPQWGLSLTVCASVFFLGVVMFNRAEQTAIDSV